MPTETIVLYAALALCILLNLLSLLLAGRKKKDGQNEALHQLALQLHQQERRLLETLNEKQLQNLKELNRFEKEITQQLGENVGRIAQKLEERLDFLHASVEQRLELGLKRSNETFTSIIQRLAHIDAAQKSIEGLSSNIVSLQDILTDKKSRGTFGEVQLKQILFSSFGDENKNLYQTQYTFKSGCIADAVIFAPEPIGCIAIDSKFPLEHYKQSVDRKRSEAERKEASRAFRQDLKKHIDDIADKYIIEGTTSGQAILFLPAEAIFAEVHAYYGASVEYAQGRSVWIASPTTLMAVLSTLQVIVRNAKREKYAKEIHQQLVKLGEEFKRYRLRWDVLSADIHKVSKDIDAIHVTSHKISKRFTDIDQVEERGLGLEE